MSNETPRIQLRASASRLAKGLLAIPRKYEHYFPKEKCQIAVIFDDGKKARNVSFVPFDPKIKECRIFGLARWYSKRKIKAGDLLSIIIEDEKNKTYRITLDRFLKDREEKKTRRRLRSANSENAANEELSALVKLTKKTAKQLAREELKHIAERSPCQPRPKAIKAKAHRYEGVPAGLRVLLGELHDGKCQLCCFTFDKHDGEPYFEIHHLDPSIGHHPSNLLLLCANCHAQFEHARVTDFEWFGNWVVGVRINGKRIPIRQPLAHDSFGTSVFGLGILFVVNQIVDILINGVGT